MKHIAEKMKEILHPKGFYVAESYLDSYDGYITDAFRFKDRVTVVFHNDQFQVLSHIDREFRSEIAETREDFEKILKEV